VPSQPALGAAHPLGDSLEFAQIGGVEGEDPIRLPQIHPLEHDGFSFVDPWRSHFLPTWGSPGIIAFLDFAKCKRLGEVYLRRQPPPDSV